MNNKYKLQKIDVYIYMIYLFSIKGLEINE